MPHLDERDTYFDPDYSYKRAEIVKQFLVEPLKDKQNSAVKSSLQIMEKLKENSEKEVKVSQ